jgi:hypothetical protein
MGSEAAVLGAGSGVARVSFVRAPLRPMSIVVYQGETEKRVT